MIHQTHHLVIRVRTAMGLSAADRPLIPSHAPETYNLDHLITTKLGQAARYVYTRAPTPMVAKAARDLDPTQIYWHTPIDGYHDGHILLPPDYLRLLTYQMDDWAHPVTDAITPEHPLYPPLQSPYSGIRGTPYRPYCIVEDTSDGRTLRFQSCHSTEAHPIHCQYIPLPAIDADGGLDLTDEALDEVVNTAALLTLTATGQYDKALQTLNLLNLCQQQTPR